MEQEFMYLCKATYLYLANEKWPRDIKLFADLQEFETWCERFPAEAARVNNGDLGPLFRT